MQIERLDHFVLTVRDVDTTTSFYQTVLGMAPVTFGAGRRALVFGQSKINLHPANAPLAPHASHPVPGSADLCFVTTESPESVIDHLRKCGITIEELVQHRFSVVSQRSQSSRWQVDDLS